MATTPIDLSSLALPGASASGPMPAPNNAPAPSTPDMPAVGIGASQPSAPPDPGIDPSVPPVAPAAEPPGPHARLAAMIGSLVQAAGIGLSNFGKAGASGGKLGGAEGVIQDFGAIAEQKQRATAASTAQTNAALQQKLMQGDLTAQTANNHLLLGTLNNKMTQSDLETLKAKQDVAGEQQRQATGGLELAKGYQELAASQHYDLTDPGQRAAFFQSNRLTDPSQQGATSTGAAPSATQGAAPTGTASSAGVTSGVTPGTSGAPAGAAPTPGLVATPMQVNSTRAQATSLIEQGRAAGLSDNPKDPKFNQQFADFVKASGDYSSAKNPSFDQNHQLQLMMPPISTLAGGAEKATTTTTARIKSEQEQMGQAAYLRSVPKDKSGAPTQDFATWQSAQTELVKQRIQEGDPTPLGVMLAQGLASPAQVISSRSMSKPFYTQVLNAANKESLRITGKPYNMGAAEQQYKYVTEFNNPNNKNQQSINAGNTFLEHASDLLDLNVEYRRSGNKIVNTPLNKIASVFSNDDYAKVVAAIAPVKSEYDNALKAGFAPSAEDQKAVDAILDLKSSPAAVEAAVKVMAHTILRRMNSTNQGYRTHTGVDYPNMITPDAKTSTDKMGIDVGGLQTGGSFGGSKQVVNAGSTAAPAVAAPISKFTADPTQPARPTSIPATRIHGNGPHGPGWYEPSIFGGK